MSEQKMVLWPDLSRFGAVLTVASNPSVGANFLKFSILDRAMFSRTCGIVKGDLIAMMRDAGFSYSTSESKMRAHVAYDSQVKADGDYSAADAALRVEAERLYFYSPSIVIKKSILQQFIPALEDADFKQMPVAEVKHLDFAYLNAVQSAHLAATHQRLPDGSPGYFFTTPGDRAIVEAAASARVTINELLAYRDLPPEAVVQRAAIEGGLLEFQKFNALPVIENLMVAQTLSPSGMPLKGLRVGAAIIAYSSRASAIAANGGVEAGVEEVTLPHALPVGFEYPSKRLLVLKDSRFIEVPSLLRLQDDDEPVRNADFHWRFNDAAVELQALYTDALNRGYLDQAAWSNDALFVQAEALLTKIEERLVSMPSRSSENSKLMGAAELVAASGLRQTNFKAIYSESLPHFLERFRTSIFPDFQARRAELATLAAVKKGAEAARDAVRSKSLETQVGKREDAGAKIGGARKDYAKRYLDAAEVSALTVREMADVVTKNNVWAPLNYVEMRSRGVEPCVAWAINELRRGLPVNPFKGGWNIRTTLVQNRMKEDLTPVMCKDFIDAVSLVRDAVADVRTVNDLYKAVLKIRIDAELPYEITDSQMRSETINNRVSSEDPFVDGAGYKFIYRVLPAMEIKNGDELKSYELAQRLRTGISKTADGWDWAIKPEPVEASGDDLAAEGGAVKKAKKERPEPVIPHLEVISRTGPDYRQGRSTDEQLLMDVFGFKSLEYGNWLKNDERQVVLDHAFDAFMDLSEALQLPPRAMSLGGELAVAFGSRGRGGKSAALAHYEPGRNVINLTRMKGGGHLAHEWGHAFDYWLAKQTGLSGTNPVSETMSDHSASHNMLLSRFNTIITTSRTRLLTIDEAAQKFIAVTGKHAQPGENIYTHMRRHMRNWISGLDYRLPEEHRNGAFKEFATQALDERFIDHPTMSVHGVKVLDDLAGLSKCLKRALEVQGGADSVKGYSDTWLLQTERWYKQRVDSFERMLTKYNATSHSAESHFLDDAQYYDGFRSKAYWSTRVEMFARSFEAWVQDKIEAKPGQVSQYLVHGTRPKDDEVYSIFPRGEERELVAERMEDLFTICRPGLFDALRLHGEQMRPKYMDPAEAPSMQ